MVILLLLFGFFYLPIYFFYLTENKTSVVRNRKQEEPNCSSHQKNQCERCLPEPNLDS